MAGPLLFVLAALCTLADIVWEQPRLWGWLRGGTRVQAAVAEQPESQTDGEPSGRSETVSRVFSLFSIWLPALALFCAGLRSQAEWRRLGERSRMMEKQLRVGERPRFVRLETQPMKALGSWAWSAALESYQLAQLMIDEVADWKVLYEMHDVEP
jgi:hypothetical protein